LWLSDGDRVKKILEGIASEPGKRRIKFIQRIGKIAEEEDINLLKEAPQVLLSCITESDEEVWRETEIVLRSILRKKKALVEKHLGVLVPHVKLPGPERKRALAILMDVAIEDPKLIDEFKPILMKELENGEKDERDIMVTLLEKLGIYAKEYVRQVRATELVLDEARGSGADVTEAENALLEAKALVVTRGINDFLMRAKKAELMARYAKKVSVRWRDQVQGLSQVAIAPMGRSIAVSKGPEVLMYSKDKEVKWKFGVEGEVSALKFTSNGRNLLIGTSGNMLYLLNIDGNVIWKRRRGGAVSALDISRNRDEIFVCSDDSNVSILSMEGIETTRNWTEKPARLLSVTDDGGWLILTLGDHNLFAYDKGLLLKWRAMGGVWADISMSGDGNYILGGTQGGDAQCLSSVGIPLWKRPLGDAVKKVVVRAEVETFLIGTRREVHSFDKGGKALWRYQPKELLVSLDATNDGSFIAVVTEGGIYCIENRDVSRHFLHDLASSLKTMESFGIDMSGVGGRIEKARTCFSNNDYKQGAAFVTEIREMIEDAKLSRGSELLVLSEKMLSESKARGVDTSEGEAILHRAEEHINRGDYDGAIVEAKRALEIAKLAETTKKRVEKAEQEKRKGEIRKVIDVAVSLIDEAEDMGIETTEAEEQLQAAITASDEGEFDQALYIVKELDEIIQRQKKVIPGQTEANYARVVVVLEKEDPATEELSKAISDMNRAAKYYESNNSLNRAGDCYVLLARLEHKANNPIMSKSMYQRAINTFFRIGELPKVAKLIMDMMKEIKGEEEVPIYEIEDAFLIFKDGRLVTHHTVRLRPEMDRELLGGMLVAIQNFVEDSLMASTPGMLNELRYGNTKILIQRGAYLTMALVLTGQESKNLWRSMERLIQDIETKYTKVLSKWDGDQDKMWGVRKVFETGISQF
jgi:outer membrane protein assembly factor BamB/tetratricopeptide (TPR) repeat protein